MKVKKSTIVLTVLLVCLCSYLGRRIWQLQMTRVRAIERSIYTAYREGLNFCISVEALLTCDPEFRRVELDRATISIDRMRMDGESIGVIVPGQHMQWALSYWEVVKQCLRMIVERGENQPFAEDEKRVLMSLAQSGRIFIDELMSILESEHSLDFLLTGRLPQETHNALNDQADKVIQVATGYLRRIDPSRSPISTIPTKNLLTTIGG